MPMTAPSGRPAPRSGLRTVALFLGALLFLFEEWLWTGCMQVFAWLGRFGLLRWLDARLVRLSPAMALVIVCIPMAFLFPVKIAGLWMIARGHFVGGCLVMLAAKVASTAIIARIFLTCRPQLLRMQWFARLHAGTCLLRDRVHRWVAEQPAWRQAKAFVRHAKAPLRAWMRGRSSKRGQAAGGVRPGPLWRWRRWRRARQAAKRSDLRQAAVSTANPGERERR